MKKKNSTITVLIVEDEMIPAAYLKNIIEESEEFRVVGTASSALEAFEMVKKEKPQIIFMDIMLRGAMSGAELALQVHHLYEETLIIFMTAYSSEEMVAFAVEAEAFAYLLKPYRPKEIGATLTLAKARLKRHLPENTAGVLKLIAGFSYDREQGRLYKDGQEVALSSRELELVGILCLESHRTVERETLLREMGLTDDSLRSIIYRIRKDTSSELIQSVKRLGYRIATV
jgi:DNA-binding response OmpR family regulator